MTNHQSEICHSFSILDIGKREFCLRHKEYLVMTYFARAWGGGPWLPNLATFQIYGQLSFIFQPNMATGGWDGPVRVYEEDDKVDEKLLNQLSKWILYNRLPWLARNLGFTQAEIVRVMMQFQTAEEQIFQVNIK